MWHSCRSIGKYCRFMGHDAVIVKLQITNNTTIVGGTTITIIIIAIVQSYCAQYIRAVWSILFVHPSPYPTHPIVTGYAVYVQYITHHITIIWNLNVVLKCTTRKPLCYNTYSRALLLYANSEQIIIIVLYVYTYVLEIRRMWVWSWGGGWRGVLING